jgi:hypothetical protein
MGAWSVMALLYDNATGELVSVNTTEFNVTDNAPPPVWVSYLLIVFFSVIFIVGVIGAVRRIIIDRKKAQAKKMKRAEKEANKGKKEEKEGTSEGS